MRNNGKTWEEIARTLLLNDSTIRRYVDMYKEGGTENLLVWECRGSASKLREAQKKKLAVPLEEHYYQKASDVIAYVKDMLHG